MSKRTAKYKREHIHELLAARGKYNADYGRVVGKWRMPDGSFSYRQNAVQSVGTAFVRGLLGLLGPILLKLAFGARVEGRKNLRAIRGRGAISLCNHFHPLDTLFVRQAAGYFRTYHTVAPINNKTGLAGAVMRRGGLLPFSSNREAMRHMNAEIARLLGRGKIVNFYPEQSLWSHYSLPRPMKRGAFFYAVKNNVPVLPLFCTFRETPRGHIRRLRIHVLPAIYPDASLPPRAREEELLARAEEEWRTCAAS